MQNSLTLIVLTWICIMLGNFHSSFLSHFTFDLHIVSKRIVRWVLSSLICNPLVELWSKKSLPNIQFHCRDKVGVHLLNFLLVILGHWGTDSSVISVLWIGLYGTFCANIHLGLWLNFSLK